jgi:hypothetical protein
LSEEEAFLIAARRLGDPEALAGEFATADPRLRRKLRLRWIVIGALAVLAFLLAAEVIANLSAGGMAVLHHRGPVLGWTSGLMGLLVFLIGGLLIWRLLTDDAAAGRLFKLGLLSVGLLGAFLVLILAAAAWRGGSIWLPGPGIPQIHLLGPPLISFWFRAGLLLLPPLFLLLILWLLIRPRGKAR